MYKFRINIIPILYFFFQQQKTETKKFSKQKNKTLNISKKYFFMFAIFFSKFSSCVVLLDGPAVVNVNIFVRSISKIDDVVMVSEHDFPYVEQTKIKTISKYKNEISN